VASTQKPRIYSDDWATPTSIGFWGGSATDRALLASAFGRRIDPETFWLQVEDPSEPRDPGEYAVVGKFPSDHVFYLRPADLQPSNSEGNMASWLVRDDVTAEARLRTLADFARLPLLAQQILEGRSAYSPTKVLVIANSNRIQPYYPTEEGGIRPFLDALNSFAATMIFTLTDTPAPNSRDVDYLFRIIDPHPGEGGTTRVTCVQGAPRGAPGLFSPGFSRDLPQLLESIGHI